MGGGGVCPNDYNITRGGVVSQDPKNWLRNMCTTPYMEVFASWAIYCSKSYFFLVISNFAAIIVQAGKSCFRLRFKVKVNTLLEKWVLQNSAFYFQFSNWLITLYKFTRLVGCLSMFKWKLRFLVYQNTALFSTFLCPPPPSVTGVTS